MHRRQFIIGSAVLTAALAGCSGGGNAGTDDGEGDGTNDDGPDWSISGELRNSDGFEAIELGGNANDDNTLTLGGELRYTGDGSVVVSGMFYNLYDTDGRGMVSVSVGLDSERTLAAGDTMTFEQTTEDLGKADAGTVGSFEAVVSSGPA